MVYCVMSQTCDGCSVVHLSTKTSVHGMFPVLQPWRGYFKLHLHSTKTSAVHGMFPASNSCHICSIVCICIQPIPQYMGYFQCHNHEIYVQWCICIQPRPQQCMGCFQCHKHEIYVQGGICIQPRPQCMGYF
jgi:hypothetical protein